ncbi:MAG TPA: single-stranded DNA-binding protein, partial [Bacteroidales bacterium]|nr:single-stranded DNA-binding protein [Bacteroidales bacterium]
KLLYVEGRLRTNTYDDKETGVKKYFTEIHCSNFRFLGPSTTDGVTRDERSDSAAVKDSGKEDDSLMPQPDDDLPF